MHTLRTLADCRAIIEAADGAKRAVVIGASFIGLEVAASLRAREDSKCTSLRPRSAPLERVFGPQMGDFVRRLHEEHGVVFHLEDTSEAIDGKTGQAQERHGARCGSRRRSALACGRASSLAEQAGLAIDRGVTVDALSANQRARTSLPPAISRAGPIRTPARRIRVEHWVVAERQGQTAALNMLGHAPAI